METITNYLLIFFSYAFAGWIIEVTLKLIQYRRFINRGFLAGPWLPIYGFGALLITAARWWDYSTKPMNLHGRVWIGNLVLFGLGGVIIVKLTNPIFLGVFSSIIKPVKIAIAGGLTLIIAADYVVSHFVLKLVKTGVEKSEADNTEEINREIRTLLRDRSVFARRFAEAYPNVIYRTEKIAARMEQIRKETERLKQNVEARLEEIGTQIDQKKTEIAYNIETSGSIKNRILEKQSSLIDILYDENNASEDAKKLKKEIDSENIRLNRKWLQRGISSDSSDEN